MDINELVVKIIKETQEPASTWPSKRVLNATMPAIHARNIELSIKTLILDFVNEKLGML